MKKLLLLIVVLTIVSCETLDLGDVGAVIGNLDSDSVEAIIETAEAGQKAMEDITPEQEYYIGRAIGATILDQYKVWEDKEATDYVNRIGKALSLFSDRPETFGGYHFLLLDSDEINAFAAPSGHIFISRGIIRLTRNEDDLAAILAHEIAHVVHQHGLDAIKKSRMTSFLTILGTNAAKEFGSEDVAELTDLFEGTISDITSTLVNSGYSREFERESDAMTLTILERTGYDKHGLIRVINRMSKEMDPKGLDFAKTHPDPLDRLSDLEDRTGVSGNGNPGVPSARYKDNLRKL